MWRIQPTLRVFQSHKAEASKHGGQSQPGPDPENTKMWQFISDEYNDLTVFVKQLRKILLRKSLTVQVSKMAGVLDDLIKYSYRFY